MNKIKVAVVDSGIDGKHALIKESLKEGVEIYLDENGDVKYNNSYSDVHGHGTAVAGIIKKICSNVELYSVKILDKNLESYGILLIEAIRWCIKNKMKIVNLSIGTKIKKWKDKMQKVCSKAYRKEVIIVAALPYKKISYPAIFHNVIAVTIVKSKNENSYGHLRNPKVEILLSRRKLKVAWVNTKDKFVGMNLSFATAKVTGVIAKLLLKEPNLNIHTLTNILMQKEKW